MKVLVACEFSGTVRNAFAAKGHDAWSCDLLQTESDGQHLIMDNDMHLKDTLYNQHWDMVIAHPPCTYLSYAATKYWNDTGRSQLRNQAAIFFLMIYNCPVKKVCIENPVGWMNTVFRKPDQIIHPWQFGQSANKRTCLWLVGLPKLIPTNIVDKPAPTYVDKVSGKKRYFTDAISGGKQGQKERSLTFPGIAKAMAEQWNY